MICSEKFVIDIFLKHSHIFLNNLNQIESLVNKIIQECDYYKLYSYKDLDTGGNSTVSTNVDSEYLSDEVCDSSDYDNEESLVIKTISKIPLARDKVLASRFFSISLYSEEFHKHIEALSDLALSPWAFLQTIYTHWFSLYNKQHHLINVKKHNKPKKIPPHTSFDQIYVTELKSYLPNSLSEHLDSSMVQIGKEIGEIESCLCSLFSHNFLLKALEENVGEKIKDIEKVYQHTILSCVTTLKKSLETLCIIINGVD